MTHDIIISIYFCHKAGDKSKAGPEGLDTYWRLMERARQAVRQGLDMQISV